MHPIFFIFKYLVIDALILLSIFNVGSLVAPLKESSKLEKYFLRSCLGLGMWGTAIFCLGIMHGLYSIVVGILFAASLQIRFRSNLSAIKTLPKCTGLNLYAAALILVCCSFQFLSSLYPPHSFDDTMYHLASARLYVKHHALVLLPYVRYSVFNEQMDMLFTAALAACDDIAAQQIPLIANFLILIGIYTFLKQRLSARAGIIGCTVWLSSQLATKLSIVAYIDVPLALMCLAATYTALCLCLKEDEQGKTYAKLCGAFCGFAVATKYTGGVFALAILGCIFAYGALKHVRTKEFYAKALWAPLLTILLSAPWFIRNLLLTGNPVFPFLPTLFGLGGLWTLQDYAVQIHDFSLSRTLAFTVPNYLLSLWNLSSNPSMDFQLTYSPLFFVGTVLAFAFAVSGNVSVAITLIPTLCYLLAWFLTSQYPRYAIPVLPLAALYTGTTIELIIRSLISKALNNKEQKDEKPNKVVLNGITFGICLCAAGFAIIGSIGKSFKTLTYYGEIPSTASERKVFLGHAYPTHSAYDYLNQLPKGNLYELNDEYENYYYVNGTFMGDWFGPGRYADTIPLLQKGKELYEHLSKLDTKYFLVTKMNKNGEQFVLADDDYFHDHFKKIFEDSACVVFVLVP